MRRHAAILKRPSYRPQMQYYSVHALKDGTIWLATDTTLPRRQKGVRPPQVDQDGIWQVWIEGSDSDRPYVDWVKGAREASVATCLNMRRVLRSQIEPKIDAIHAQLKQLEGKVDQLLARLGEG